MKTIFTIFLGIFLFSNFSFSQNQYSDEELLKMNIFDICDALGIPSDYSSRYNLIILPLCENGIILFGKDSNPYTKDLDEASGHVCYFYIGTSEQNQKLIRNLVRNRKLFQDGKLVAGAIKKWELVD